ncbi:MAG: prolyl oligopeptidase family serine peptidase [Hyphomonadaceae bacterium]
MKRSSHSQASTRVTLLGRLTAWLAGCVALGLLATPAAVAKPPVEAFGETPLVHNAELSPDGKQLAYLSMINNEDTLFVYDFATAKARPIVRVGDLRTHDVSFLSKDYVVLVVSKTASNWMFRGKWEASAAFAINLDTGKIRQLLKGTPGIYPAQSGLGQIIAVDPDGRHVYMPAYMGSVGSDPHKDVVFVDLETGRGRVKPGFKGQSDTIDWIMNNKGEAVVREDHSVKNKRHEVRNYQSKDREAIFQADTVLPATSIIGLSPSGNLILSDDDESGYMSIYEMSLNDGSVTGPIFGKEDRDVDAVIMDVNRKILGVRYSGIRPTYEMLDPALTKAIANTQEALPASSIWLDSWTDDFSKLLFFVEGGAQAQRYMVYDARTATVQSIATVRPDIKPEDVGETFAIEYPARDGLTISAVLTWPTGSTEETRKNLPLVVLPHGGPQAYDQLGWDWLAQFIANQGYMVLQPNFRGSAGFGAAFRNAGRGEWGGKMQDDITDGLEAMVHMGWADPKRVCIVGWSYGGYAALAGGALTPDKYRCVASIAGVSDLRAMLNWERSNHGGDSQTVAYWERNIGDPSADRDRMDAASPARLADNFQAPVLLVHGTDDTVVDPEQSIRMEKALRNASKDVTFIKIRGDDHSLVDNASRVTMLSALADFLATNLNPAPVAQ